MPLLSLFFSLQFLLKPLGRLGAAVTGIDPLEDNIRTGGLHKSFDPVLEQRVQYRACSLEDIVEHSEEGFDAVVASEVVEHVNDVEAFIHSCFQVLKVSELVSLYHHF